MTLQEFEEADLQELKEMTDWFITPKIASKFFKCNPYLINVASRTEEGRKSLGFPVTRMGTRVKIPRKPFIQYINGEKEQENT